MLSEFQTAWIWMRGRVTRRLIRIQAVCILNNSRDRQDKGEETEKLYMYMFCNNHLQKTFILTPVHCVTEPVNHKCFHKRVEVSDLGWHC